MLSGVKNMRRQEETEMRVEQDQEEMICTKCKETIIGRAMKARWNVENTTEK